MIASIFSFYHNVFIQTHALGSLKLWLRLKTFYICIYAGDTLGLDVNSVCSRDQLLCYSVTLVGYGYMGDLLKDSENKRWMGPSRYDVSGKLVTVVANVDLDSKCAQDRS